MGENAAQLRRLKDAMKAKARTQGSGQRRRQFYDSIVRLAKCFTIAIKQSLSHVPQGSILFIISLFGKEKSPTMGFTIVGQR